MKIENTNLIHLPNVITISLKENVDRQQSAVNELAKLGLKTTFLLVDRDRGHEERGCFNSHIAAVKQAMQDENCDYALICEDDVKILPFNQRQIKQINQFLKKRSNRFDILYLGLIIGKMWWCGMRHIVGTRGAGAHAYIISRTGMQKLVQYEYTGIPFDKVLKYDFKCYSVFPIIAEQFPDEVHPSAIDNARNYQDVKDQKFWEKNYQKQKWILWQNLLRVFR